MYISFEVPTKIISVANTSLLASLFTLEDTKKYIKTGLLLSWKITRNAETNDHR